MSGGRRLALALGLALLAARAAPAQPLAEVGFVESFEGAASDYDIQRGEESVPVAVLTPLQAGDRIAVEGEAGRITLRVGERAIDVTPAASPFVVSADDPAASVIGNVARWVAGWSEGEVGAQGVSLVARSVDALDAPLLAQGPQRMLPRDGPLCVAWRGGQAPFSLSLEAGAEPARGARVEVEASPARLVVALHADGGPHTLRLRDATGTERSIALEVVDRGPEPPAALAGADLAPVLRETLLAAWLASAEQGRFTLESYQRLCALAPDYAPARALAGELEQGHRPAGPLELPAR